MRRRTKHAAGEWAKAALGMLAGALFLLAFQIAWILDKGCIVRKSDAQAKRYWNQVYDCAAVNTFDDEKFARRLAYTPFQARANWKQYAEQIEEIYNYRRACSDKVSIVTELKKAGLYNQ